MLITEGTHAKIPAFIGSVLAMPVLIGFLLSARPQRSKLFWLITVALVFSWLGDWLGDLIPPTVLTKIAFFFVGHVFFILAFWPYRRRSVLHKPVILIAYVIVLAALLAWIAPSSGRLAIPVVVYGAFLGFMAVLSTGLNRTAGVGGAIFVVSDLSIAVTSFVLRGTFDQAELVIMSTYLVAQFLIVLGAMWAVLAPDVMPAGAEANARPGRLRS